MRRKVKAHVYCDAVSLKGSQIIHLDMDARRRFLRPRQGNPEMIQREMAWRRLMNLDRVEYVLPKPVDRVSINGGILPVAPHRRRHAIQRKPLGMAEKAVLFRLFPGRKKTEFAALGTRANAIVPDLLFTPKRQRRQCMS